MKRGCTQCGECLNVCPVYALFHREEYSPKGKRILMEPLGDWNTEGGDPLSWPTVRGLARLCAGCDRCKQRCARKLSTCDLLAQTRSKHPHWTQALWDMWIRRAGPLWPTAGRLALMFPQSLTPAGLLPALADARNLVDRQDHRIWFRLSPAVQQENQPEPKAGALAGSQAKSAAHASGQMSMPNPAHAHARPAAKALRVAVFAGCTAVNVRPQWTAKANKLLTAWGYDVVDASAFTCCGGTLHHAGLFQAQRKARNANLALWRKLGRPVLATFCASCLHSLHAYADAEDLLSPQEAGQWRANVRGLSSLLCQPVVRRTADAPARASYHQPCHWGDQDPDLPFLQNALPGLEKGRELCCGMGGILKMNAPDLSEALGRRCLEGLPHQEILTGCSGCVMQLGALAKQAAVRHWLDVADTFSEPETDPDKTYSRGHGDEEAGG